MTSLGLVFDGDIDLLDDAGADGYSFEALEGIDFGNPVPIEVALSSFLRDGSIVSKTGDENRELVIPVRVKGADLLSLAEGEARLNLACGKRTTLVWTPLDGIAPPTVFDVLTSRLEAPPFDDLAELRNERTYSLRLTCLPHSRSVGLVSEDSATAGSGGTVVDACESTTGWSHPADSSPAVVVDSSVFAAGTGSVRFQAPSVYQYLNPYGYQQSRAGVYAFKSLSVATGSGGYMSVLIKQEWGAPPLPSPIVGVTVKMTTAALAAYDVSAVATEYLAGGFVRYAWELPASDTVTNLEIHVVMETSYWENTPPKAWFDSITTASAATTEHQIVKTIDVLGSARSPGSLFVASPSLSTALSDVFLLTMAAGSVPAGFRPDMRRWLTAGSSTADAACVTGSKVAVTSTMGACSFEVPASMLSAGSYMVVVRAKTSNSTIQIDVEAQLKIGGTTTGPLSKTSGTQPYTGGGYVFMSVGTIGLPPAAMASPDSAAKVLIRLGGGGGDLDEMYLCPVEADLSIISCGASSRLWVDSPSPAQPGGGWSRGSLDARVNAFSAINDAIVLGRHTFTPPKLLAFLVSTGAVGPSLTLEYFPHHHTHATV